jgi:hypothetical protein
MNVGTGIVICAIYIFTTFLTAGRKAGYQQQKKQKAERQ